MSHTKSTAECDWCRIEMSKGTFIACRDCHERLEDDGALMLKTLKFVLGLGPGGRPVITGRMRDMVECTIKDVEREPDTPRPLSRDSGDSEPDCPVCDLSEPHSCGERV